MEPLSDAVKRAWWAALHTLARVIVVFAFTGGPVQATDADELNGTDPASAKMLDELLEVTGVFAGARSAANTMVERLHQENPVVPPDVWSHFAAKIADHETLSSLYVPIYARHLTDEDVRGILAFYRSPTGQHFLSAIPGIQQDCAVAAQAWAANVAADLLSSDASAPRRSHDRAVTARDSAIHELLRSSGAIGQARQTMTLMMERLQKTPQAADLPPSFWQNARERLTNEADLLELWTPAYAHHLPEVDVRGITDFYRSPVGTRYVAALPAIQQESVEAATQLANNAARRAIREVLGPLPQWRLEHPQPAQESTSPPAGAP
jgi:hypothetical protein